jgi:cell division protein FtsI/penicillin-binding protein 2
VNTEGVTRGRIRFILMVMAGAVAALVLQLVRVQFGPYAPVFAARAEYGAAIVERVVPARGQIYDRNGALLAANGTMFYIEIEVRQLTEKSKKDIPLTLSKLLLLPLEDLYTQVTTDWPALGQYRIRLTRKNAEGSQWPLTVDKTVAGVINGFLADPLAPDLSGLDLVAAPKRVYPSGTIAGHVLGFVNQEGQGFYGVEGYYDEWLSGKPITVHRPFIPLEARLQPNPPSGVNLVLTLDLAVQQMVETVLKETIESSLAESGQVVIMDPRNGEILAMAAWPVLDPNNYEPWLPDTVEEEEGNPVITPGVAGTFEPGSTFKVLTMAAALDLDRVKPETEFIDNGQIEVGGHIIRNWDGRSWGQQTMVGCLEHSLNVCLAWIASDRLGATDLYTYLSRFGIGQLTGVDLAGEVSGELRTPRDPDWTESDIGTNSFGQGLSLTPLQLLTAVSALANHGDMVQPHMVRQVVGPQGAYWPQPTVLGRPITRATADTLTEMLGRSLEGETRYAAVPGYRLAGKTGTAQIATEKGYDPKWTVASFVGWGPLPDPRFLVLVRIDKPATAPWGSVIAAPAFQEITERLVVMLGLPPDTSVAQLAVGG